MIVKMKKYLFLIYHEQYAEFLDFLKQAGVVHIAQRDEGVKDNDQLRNKMQISANVKKAIEKAESILGKGEHELMPARNTSIEEGLEVATEFDEKQKAIEALRTKVANLTREMTQMEVWGEFSFERLKQMRDAGLYVNFFSCSERKYQPEWEETFNAFKISETASTIYFVTVTKEENIDIDADPFKTTGKTSSELRLEIDSVNKEITEQENSLRAWAAENLLTLKRLALQIEEAIDLSNVQLNTEDAAEGTVMILEGYCPADSEKELDKALDNKGVYYEVSDPEFGEEIPVKLKNSRYSKLFEPITKLYSLPNYSELDLTPFLAPFFMLFFGLCLGDGGYGLLILIAATALKGKLKKPMRPYASLFQWLGAMTLVAGLLTGSFFGIALDSVTWPWLANVKQLFFTSKNYKEAFGGFEPMMVVSLAIGLIQIFLGMSLNVAKIIKQHGVKYALAPTAWIVGLIGSAVTFILPMAGIKLPVALTYIFIGLIAASVVLIVFYNSPDSYKSPIKGFFVNIGSSLWAAYNTATGLLGDTLSYVRLFALGLTGSILGSVFNQLAFTFGEALPSVLGWIVTLFILLFGHALNFALNMIGAFVHPLRLTFVEFYKNSGFEGGGKAYEPFRQKIQQTN